ncbi:hypothetical protein [Dinghuibacter silviterrae]|uniref:Uncharacterized protein n=1 Tax=Dinghuibacter silviterrae TaxID=1539049 RepID=A0A4R8DV39_9BACT|nr:hypothetical protein [Dinghuibacter silviterrae]TDX02049.1 hypothetical protein EDB95_3097 [Dinghuibacter silviterrae]
MLQNRVDPLGSIITTPARGAWMGNRGLIHDDHRHIERPFRLKAWLICLLQFKDRHREVMTPRRYTELFFLDEATAFSAGHRPCFECRRPDYERFKACWMAGNPGYGFDARTSIASIDAVLHAERIDKRGFKVLHTEPLASLPDGTFILFHEQPFLLSGGRLFPWSPFGYGEAVGLPSVFEVIVLTPASTVNAFRAGYVPQTAPLATWPPTV